MPPVAEANVVPANIAIEVPAGRRRVWPRSALLVILPLVLLAALFTRGIDDPSYGFPDADRILMDGVFIYDLLRTLPFDNPLEWALGYYAQYPALSIGYRPPFFPTIEALFFAVGGVSMFSARLALVVLAMVGVAAFMRTVSRMFDPLTASAAAIMLVSLPFVAQWSWYTMGEVPTLSMLLLTAWAFHAYVTDGRARDAYLAAILFALAMWTKQTAAFAVLWFVPYILWAWGPRRVFTDRHVWLATALCAVLVAPLAAMTLWLGDLNIAQSLGENPRGAQLPRWHIDNLMVYPRMLVTEQLTAPVLLLSAAGTVWAVMRRDRRIVFFALLILATFIFFTALNDPKLPRYTIFWVPAFCLLAALPLHYLRSQRDPGAVAAGVVMVAIAVGVNIAGVYRLEPHYRSGYDEAAAYVVRENPGRAVLIQAHNNGYFTYFVRQYDPGRRTVVLRGDKLLTSSAIEATTWLKVHATSREEIREILSRNRITMVVAESHDWTGLPIHSDFVEYLKTDHFELRRQIPIRSSMREFRSTHLNVYAFVAPVETDAQDLTIDVPLAGKRVRVPADGSPLKLENYR